MTAELLTKGTATRTAPEIVQSLESLGGVLESGASWDSSNVHINVMADKVVQAMEVLADVVRRPVFSPVEVERLRKQLLDDLKVALQEPGVLTGFVAARVVFGSGPYGHPISGTRVSLAHIKRSDIVALHKKYYRPDNSILVAAGQCKRDEIVRIAERLFADWPKPSGDLLRPSLRQLEPAVLNAGGLGSPQRVVAIHMPRAGQAAVAVAGKSLRRTDPEYFCGLVANSILGGGYSARLNQEIRIKRGLSYGAASILDARLNPGVFVASVQTKNDSAAEVVSLIVDELQRLQNESVPAAELGPRKAVLIGNFGRSLQTTDGLVGRIASLTLYGLGLGEINDYIRRVQSVSAEEVQQFARKHLVLEDFGIVVVGDASKFSETLGNRYPQLEVIPLGKLSLETASLRKRASGGNKPVGRGPGPATF
jgi:zinc protease